VGDPTVAVRDVTPVVTDVSADEETIRGALLVLNRAATFGAFVYEQERRTVLQSTTGYFHTGNADVQRVFTLATIFGNYEAHGRADALAALLGGRPADTAHPLSGERPLPDGMLMIAEEARRVGEESSHFAGPVFGALHESPYIPWVMANGDEENLTGEFAFIHGTPAMVAAMTGQEPGTALLQISTEARHPAFGNGALMLMRLPIRVDEEPQRGGPAIRCRPRRRSAPGPRFPGGHLPTRAPFPAPSGGTGSAAELSAALSASTAGHLRGCRP
jgi:hypothetical protein